MIHIETDTISRKRIVSEIDKNFFVEAGAGAGKTTMLVSRMVAMVEAGIDISKICAITFTKAAAGEFYDRFQRLLIERSNPAYVWKDKGFAGQLPAPTDKTRELCAAALQNIDLCFMGTIDSFCSMVLSEHPSEAGIPSDATIMSDMDAQSLYKQIYVKISAGEYGERLKEMARTFRIFHWNAEEVFVKGESIFMNHRNVHFNFKSGDAVDIDKVFAHDKNAINRAMKCLLDHPELKYEKTKDSVAAWEVLEENSKKFLGKWSNQFSRVQSGLKSLKKIRLIPSALEKYEYELAACFEPGGKKGAWLEFSPALDGGLLDKMNRLAYDASMTFLSECVPVIEEAMRDKGAMTYFDYLYYLRNMLKKDAAGDGKLIRYIYDRHSYFLIDEFQDTNPMQAEVFFYLSSENPVEQWSACQPRQGSLFIVGDPKQSIYRFRSADVTSFLKVKKLFQANGGDILYLTRNFRSTKKLISYFNLVFPNMLSEETELQSKFEEIPLPENESKEFQGIYKYTAYTGSLGDDHEDEKDPVQIRNIITKLVRQEKYKVSVDGGEPRPIRYSDIMVITYGKSKIDNIMEALDAAEIPMRVEGKIPFERNEALRQIYDLYNSVADTRDQNALFYALKGYFIGACEEEMMKFRLVGGEISLLAANDLADDAHPTTKKVAGHITKIKELSQKAEGLSPAALFAEIMDHYEVYRIAPVENMEILYYTLELLRNAEKTGLVVSLKDGANYIAKLLSGSSDEERCLSLNDSKDCVHIANLHKVKGLEAPIVILAAGTQFSSSVSSRIVHGDHGSEGYIFALESERIDGRSYPYVQTDEYSDEKDMEKMALKAEHDRLIYVAATRARNTLIICDSILSSFGKESHKSIWKPLLEHTGIDIFDAIADADEPVVPIIEEVEVDPLYQKAKEECVLNDRTAENESFKVENPSRARLSSKIAEEVADVIIISEENDILEGNGISEKNDISDEIDISNAKKNGSISDVHRLPALLGTMTHRLMEIMVSTRNTCDTNAVIDEIIREYRTPKNQPYEGKLIVALKEVAKTMNNGGYVQKNQLPQDLLKVLLGAEEVYCEVPFCFRDVENDVTTVWNGVMDVVYCESGKWHIVDYKTNLDGDNLDIRYQEQLSAYKKAFKEITGNDADAFTYHINI